MEIGEPQKITENDPLEHPVPGKEYDTPTEPAYVPEPVEEPVHA